MTYLWSHGVDEKGQSGLEPHCDPMPLIFHATPRLRTAVVESSPYPSPVTSRRASRNRFVLHTHPVRGFFGIYPVPTIVPVNLLLKRGGASTRNMVTRVKCRAAIGERRPRGPRACPRRRARSVAPSSSSPGYGSIAAPGLLATNETRKHTAAAPSREAGPWNRQWIGYLLTGECLHFRRAARAACC